MQSGITTITPRQDTAQLLNYLKKHYEHICKLCAMSNIPYLPAIKSSSLADKRFTAKIQSLESALNHIKAQLRQLIASCDQDQELMTQITDHPELCESLSNYRRELESLFHQLQKINNTDPSMENNNS